MRKFLYGALVAVLLQSSFSFAAEKPKVCQSGQHWVSAHSRKAYKRTDGTLVSAAFVSGHCQTNPPSYQLWKDKIKASPSENWIKRGEKRKAWNTADKERVFEALSALPAKLLTNKVISIYRLEKSSLFDKNPASGEAGEIAIYDKAFEKGANLARILAHEFAHELYRQFSGAEKKDYQTVAKWLLPKNPNTGDYHQVPNREDGGYVEADGHESMDEDFSNNVEYFLFDPQKLKKKTPEVYEWIKRKFGDNFKVSRGG